MNDHTPLADAAGGPAAGRCERRTRRRVGNGRAGARAAALLFFGFSLLAPAGCMEWSYDYAPVETRPAGDGSGLFIVNEGNFQYGNASLSFYDAQNKAVENEVFLRANDMKLGDVAQSMTVRDRVGWITVCNSHVLFAIDLETFREVGRIVDLTAPRYIHFLSNEKAYVTQLWDNRIFVVDPSRFEITGHIECPGMTPETGSTEQMVRWGDYVYVNCWSYQNRVLKIDTRTDRVVDALAVGMQPAAMALDRNGKLWILTDGGYAGSPYGHEAPSLSRVDAETFAVERQFRFREDDRPAEMQLDGDGDTLYFINDDVWRMPVSAESLPATPFLRRRDTKYYGLSVDPRTSEVYVSDAIDYQQQGVVYRFSPEGELLDEFYVGVNPGAFCWY